MDKLCYSGRSSDSAAELFSFVQKIKSRDMRTNSVFTLPVLEDLRRRELAWIAIGDEAALVLCPDTERVARIFYYAQNAAALPEMTGLLPATSEHLICDIVGKELTAAPQVKELQDNSFSLYAKFQRMTCASLSVDPTLDFSRVEPAVPADAREIYELLHREFDPLTARMPALSVLEKRIRDSEVLVVRANQTIAGFCVFSSGSRRVALLEYVIVRPEYRREKIARTILHYKWKYQNQSQQYILWVNAQLSAPIHFHESNGFRADGIYDYILLPKQDIFCDEGSDAGCS